MPGCPCGEDGNPGTKQLVAQMYKSGYFDDSQIRHNRFLFR
jgi:hypothetical protein